MKEELYIYDKEDVRRSLDINTPSGITLKWVSNLFNSLDKVNCSYSYTFKIPMTNHNRNIMDITEDIRHNSGIIRKKLKAEFIQNGITLFKNANLYIDKVDSISYSCVFTWDNIEGLQNLKDNGCSLNELRTALVDKGITDDELSEDGVCDWYVNWLRQDDVLSIFSNATKILYPYYGSYPSDSNYSEYPDYSNIVTQGVPRPAMPVRYIIDCINKAFDTKFNFGQKKSGFDTLPIEPTSKWLTKDDNIINYGVLPLIGKDLTENQEKSLSKNLIYDTRMVGFSSAFKVAGILGTFGIFLFQKNYDYIYPFYAYEDKLNYLMYEAYDSNGKSVSWKFPDSLAELNKHKPSSKSEAYNVKYACVGIEARFDCTIKMEASFYIELSWFTKLTQDIYGKLKLKVYSWKTVNKGYNDEHIEKIEVASFSATKLEKVIGTDNMELARLYFNFCEDEGYEPATFCSDESALNGTDSQEYWFGIGEGLFEVKDLVIQRDFIFTPKVNDMDECAHKMDSFTNLPDIDCISFMKSLFYIEGGFPFINSFGEIVIKKYSEIKENLSKGFIYDWSSRVIERRESYDELSFNVGDFKQNNYYMNKWDDIDRTQSDIEKEDDVYENGIGDIKCDDSTLNSEQTIHQFPFYPPYILNRKNPGATDKTVKGVDFSPANNSLSVNDRGEIINKNKPKYIELKAAYGYVHRIPFFDKQKEWRIKSWEENYGLNNYIRMSVLNPFKDILMNPSYRYLQKIVEHPIVITEKLLLNEFDLMDIDYVKPVYLEKYNSYFAIISIQRDSKGVCKCELIKLPTYQPPVKVTLSFESQYSKFLHYKVSSTSKEDKTITIGFIIENSNDGQYVQHSKVNLKGDSFQIFNPTSNTNWVIKDVWLDHYEEGDYNDYEFEIQ